MDDFCCSDIQYRCYRGEPMNSLVRPLDLCDLNIAVSTAIDTYASHRALVQSQNCLEYLRFNLHYHQIVLQVTILKMENEHWYLALDRPIDWIPQQAWIEFITSSEEHSDAEKSVVSFLCPFLASYRDRTRLVQ